jgi:hypothetical protein
MTYRDEERQVLYMFYDARLKIRRNLVPAFYLYARVCEGKNERNWEEMISRVDQALLNLDTNKFISKARSEWTTNLSKHVGTAAELYELTAAGLIELQSMEPSIGLKLRAYISVMPPWFVVAGSIGGGVASVWKIIEWTQKATHFFTSGKFHTLFH